MDRWALAEVCSLPSGILVYTWMNLLNGNLPILSKYGTTWQNISFGAQHPLQRTDVFLVTEKKDVLGEYL